MLKCKKNIKKKLILLLVVSILIVITFNFLFVLTDYLSSGIFNIKAILYSPIANEVWLSFWGNIFVGLATFLLFYTAHETLKNERKKLKIETLKYKRDEENRRKELIYEKKKLKLIQEKETVMKYLSSFDINDINNIWNRLLNSGDFSDETLKNFLDETRDIIKKMNLLQLKLDFETNLRVIKSGNLKQDLHEKEKNKRYHELVDLRKIYLIPFNDIDLKIKSLLETPLKEREKKISIPNDYTKEEKDRILDIFEGHKEFWNKKNNIMIIDRNNFHVCFDEYFEYSTNKIHEYFIILEDELEKSLN